MLRAEIAVFVGRVVAVVVVGVVVDMVCEIVVAG